MIRERVEGTGFPNVTGVTFTATDRKEGSMFSESMRIGKVWLVSRLRVLLERGELTIEDSRLTEPLIEELRVFELRRREQDGQVSAGAFRTGAHDDLVVALGLACIEDPTEQGVGVGPNLFE